MKSKRYNYYLIYHIRLYQRFIRLEYLAANSALSFWKELLQSNHFNTQLLQLKGAQITNCYTQI